MVPHTGETFSCNTSILGGGGQKLAAVRLLRYCTHIFSEKGITFVSSLLGLGALNKFRLVPLIKMNPSIGAQRLQKSIQIEMIIALFILSFSGFLTTSTTLPMGG